MSFLEENEIILEPFLSEKKLGPHSTENLQGY